jgi:hypothetical protein
LSAKGEDKAKAAQTHVPACGGSAATVAMSAGAIITGPSKSLAEAPDKQPVKSMGYRLKATRQSDRNEGERVCGKAMCNTSGGLHDASGK